MADDLEKELHDSFDRMQRRVLCIVEDRNDLLTLLRWCVENDGECLADNPLKLARARAAIARATGEAT
jgi:hypothetical protein